MIGSRSPAFRSIVEHKVIRGEIMGEVKKYVENSGQSLGSVISVNDRQMTRQNGEGIAEDDELLAVWKALFFRRQPLGAEKTLPLPYCPVINGGSRARETARIVLGDDANFIENEFFHPDVRQPFNSFFEEGPGLLLVGHQDVQQSGPPGSA